MVDSYGLDTGDPLAIPLIEQFTVVAIRKYRNQARQRHFWQPVLRDVEQEIGRMVSLINSKSFDENTLYTELAKRSRRIDEIYQNALTELARQQGKKGARVEAKVCCGCYYVQLQTIPPQGVIKYISAGRWSLYIFMTRERGVADYPKPEWITIAQPDSVVLTGKNWFYVRWPNGADSMDLVNVESSDTITFYPE